MSKPNRIDQTNQGNRVGSSRQSRSAVLRSVASKDPVAVPPQSSQSSSLGQRAMLKKQAIRERFDRLASERESWQQRASYYYHDQRRYLRFLVPEGLKVLEIGCGLGDQLAALKPRRGVGIDLSEAMVKEASKRHPELEFLVGDGEALALDETFDVIIARRSRRPCTRRRSHAQATPSLLHAYNPHRHRLL